MKYTTPNDQTQNSSVLQGKYILRILEMYFSAETPTSIKKIFITCCLSDCRTSSSVSHTRKPLLVEYTPGAVVEIVTLPQ